MRRPAGLAVAAGRAVAATLALAGLACGPSVRSEPMVDVPSREEGAEVLLFVRDEKIPLCPWEILGTVSGERGWVETEGGRRKAEDAARRMGGQALLLATRTDAEAQVVRFLDPYSICDPVAGPPES